MQSFAALSRPGCYPRGLRAGIPTGTGPDNKENIHGTHHHPQRRRPLQRLPGSGPPAGRTPDHRLRLLARDVSLALSRPQDISVLNVLEGTVHDVVDLSTGAVLVKVALNRDLIIDARVTKRACDNLKLTAGVNVFALIKSVAVDKFQRTIP